MEVVKYVKTRVGNIAFGNCEFVVNEVFEYPEKEGNIPSGIQIAKFFVEGLADEYIRFKTQELKSEKLNINS